MRVFITAPARDDLRDIASYLALDNAARATKVLIDLRETCEGLGDNPERHPIVRELGDGVRRAVHRQYLIFYRVGEDVEVLRVLHSARNYDRLLFPDD